MQMTSLLLNNKRGGFYLYAIILFPGVFLHELSHWVMANLLWVTTYRLSLKPQILDDGSYVLGYVESGTRSRSGRQVGAIRWSLIGVAPLLFGVTVILLIGFYVFDINRLTAVSEAGFSAALNTIFATQRWALWLYILFAVSNAMMPSKPDRHAWPTFIVMVMAVIGFLYVIGVLEQLWLNMAPFVLTAFTYLGVAFTITIIVNILFLLVIVLFKHLLIFWRI
jgi:hypothetical protein